MASVPGQFNTNLDNRNLVASPNGKPFPPNGGGPAPSPQSRSQDTRVYMLVGVVMFVIVIIAIVVAAVVISGDDDDFVAGDFELFPAETRTDNNFIGVSFLVPVSQTAGDAFVNASNRWSTILAGNENLVEPAVATNFNICGLAVIDQIVVDHLFILATVQPDDGPGGILGFAGPCDVALNVFIPVFGQMTFDSADIDILEADGSLESVILHEMAHVLGIGTLWTFVGLIVNELPGAFANPNLPSPIYVGPFGTQAFLELGGVGSLGIEDGFTNGQFNGAGPGSVNGHFDEDSVDIELMTFQIKVTEPPLSTVTIQSLVDLGYAIDITQADDFNLNSRSLQNTDYKPLDVPHVLSGDAWIYEKFSVIGGNE